MSQQRTLRSISVIAYSIFVRHENAARTAQSLGANSQVHIDSDGREWYVTVHWARVDENAIPVGLDLHAFVDEQRGGRMRTTGGMLTAGVLRSLRVAEVVEASRRQGTWPAAIDRKAATTRRSPAGPPATATPARMPGRPTDRGDDFVAEVAALYHEAKTQGGEPARKPWRYVAAQLDVRGVHEVTDGQLKNWSRRAKNLGLLSTNRKEKQ